MTAGAWRAAGRNNISGGMVGAQRRRVVFSANISNWAV